MINTEIPSTIQTQESKANTTQSRNQTSQNIESSSPKSRKKSVKINQKAIEEYKKMCVKSYGSPSSLIINQLRSDKLNIFLDSFNLKDINTLVKILNKYTYFLHIKLGPYDPRKGDSSFKQKKNGQDKILTQGDIEKEKREKRELNIQRNLMIKNIIHGISKNLKISLNLISFSLTNLKITVEIAEELSPGLIENKSLKALLINNCTISIEAYDLLLKGLLTHENLSYLDLANNNFNDKYSDMIARIIARQTQRRDQVVWAFGLRNEKPTSNDYTNGLVSISLKGNALSDTSAEVISNSLGYDQYIRKIDVSCNKITKDGCKKFIRMMRKNNTLLTVDLKDNPGYDEGIHGRIVMKMAKNIKVLYNKYVNEEYNEEEFQNYKTFIDESFFDVDIPQEIIDNYTSNMITIDEPKTDERNDNQGEEIEEKNESENNI